IADTIGFPPVDAEPLERTNYLLALSVAPLPSGTEVRLTYDAERFDGEDVRRMAAHYLRLLRVLADAGDWPLGSVQLLDDSERAALLSASQGPVLAMDGPFTPVHRRIERHASEFPFAPALV